MPRDNTSMVDNMMSGMKMKDSFGRGARSLLTILWGGRRRPWSLSLALLLLLAGSCRLSSLGGPYYFLSEVSGAPEQRPSNLPTFVDVIISQNPRTEGNARTVTECPKDRIQDRFPKFWRTCT